MNHPLYKMLKFELKKTVRPNYSSLAILLALNAFQIYFTGRSPFFDLGFFTFILVTIMITLLSYQESTRQQSMQMYHLIPESVNFKFISKLLITLIVYPLAMFCFFLIIQTITEIILGRSIPGIQLELKKETIPNLVILWILAHSFCTISAIVFKKNKILYAVLSYVVFRLVLGAVILVFLLLLGIKNSSLPLFSITSFPSNQWIIFGLVLLSAAFYLVSYHLFKRRQL